MAVDFAKTAAMVIIFAFLWRFAAAKSAGTRLGAAMSFIL
jgi:hypothetical protein